MTAIRVGLLFSIYLISRPFFVSAQYQYGGYANIGNQYGYGSSLGQLYGGSVDYSQNYGLNQYNGGYSSYGRGIGFQGTDQYIPDWRDAAQQWIPFSGFWGQRQGPYWYDQSYGNQGFNNNNGYQYGGYGYAQNYGK